MNFIQLNDLNTEKYNYRWCFILFYGIKRAGILRIFTVENAE